MKDDTWYDAAETEKFMGVKPAQVADLLALKGDAVDNIPGAPGIGDKGAKRSDRALRVGRGRARARRRGRAQDLPREPAEQSRADPAEQATGDHPLRRSGAAAIWMRWLRATRIRKPCARFTRRLEFHSLLRDLAPAAKPATQKDYAAAGSVSWNRGYRECLRIAPVAVAVGEMMGGDRGRAVAPSRAWCGAWCRSRPAGSHSRPRFDVPRSQIAHPPVRRCARHSATT